MKLTIKHWNGETFSLVIAETEYIDDLKDKIEELHDVPVDQQRLSYNGEEVDDTETIEGNDIAEGSTLVLEAMKITIVLPDGKKKIAITIRPDEIVKKVKKAASKKSGSPPECLIVLFDGAELRDGQKMSDCNIDHGDVVIVESFSITVAHWGGDLIPMKDLSIHDTVEKIKEILLETREIPKDQQKFKFGGNAMNDFISFKDQQVKHKAVLQLEKPVVKKEKQKFSMSVFPTDNAMNKDSKKITITVKHWNGSTFTVEGTPGMYMEELKEQIQKTSSIAVDHQRLTFDGAEVDDTETLEEQNIGDKALLTLEAMKIVVSLPGGKKKIRFLVAPTDIVKRIKRLVAKKAGIPVDRQRIMFDGKDLKDNQKLAECNIEHEDSVSIELFFIVVRHWDGEDMEIKDISPNDTTEDVKRIVLEEREDIPEDKFKLQFEGKGLNDFISLKDQKITHKSTLVLQEPPKEVAKKEKFKLTLFSTGAPGSKAKKSTGKEETITIKPTKGEPFTVLCDLGEYIADLKERIEESQKIPKDEQRLTLDGTTLDDAETLGEHSIDASTTINLEAMKIHIMLPNKKKIIFAVSLKDNVRRIKNVVRKKTGMQVDSQCLMAGGTEIFDNQKLADCGIDHEDVLTVETYTVSVIHGGGDVFVLTDIQPSDTMEDVREIILKRKQIPKDEQKFKFEGKPINDFLSLKDQKIKHKSIITMEDLEILKSPQSRRPKVQEIKYCDTSDEDSFSDDSENEADDDDDGSQASYIRRAAHDENYTKEILDDEE